MSPTDHRNVLFVAAAATMWGTWSLIMRAVDVSVWTSTPIIFAVMGLMTLPLALRAPAAARWDRGTFVLLV